MQFQTHTLKKMENILSFPLLEWKHNEAKVGQKKTAGR